MGLTAPKAENDRKRDAAVEKSDEGSNLRKHKETLRWHYAEGG
jgi:hypothetical protein